MAGYHVILNPSAGSTESTYSNQIKAAFGDRVEDMAIHAPGDIAQGARQAAAKPECRVLIAVGGDGTVRTVAAEAIAAGKTFGVIPAGTLNHFAKDAGIPQGLTEAVAVILEGHTSRVDYATVGNHVFLNNASLGIYPALVRRREQLQYRIGKWPALIWELIKLLLHSLQRYRFTLSYQDAVHRFTTPFIFIGNNDYQSQAGGFGGRHRLDAGILTLVIFTANHRLRFGVELLKTFLGKPTHPDMRTEQITEVTIASPAGRVDIALDGEVLTIKLPVTATVRPRGLSLLTPRQSSS
jgi:diacylglycerol kinase family enzyme